MTNEQAIKEFSDRLKIIEEDYKDDRLKDYAEALKMGIEALQMQEELKSDGENWLIPKRALKWRGNGYVFYNVKWFKKNWKGELERMKIDCTTCVLDNTDACTKGAGRAVDKDICNDYVAKETTDSFKDRAYKTELERRYLDGISHVIV
jgi:hypothetical protein